MNHGQAVANLAGLVFEALTHDGVDDCRAYGYSVTVANVLNANPQALADLIDALRVGGEGDAA